MSFTNSKALFEQSYVVSLSYGLRRSCLNTINLKIHAKSRDGYLWKGANMELLSYSTDFLNFCFKINSFRALWKSRRKTLLKSTLNLEKVNIKPKPENKSKFSQGFINRFQFFNFSEILLHISGSLGLEIAYFPNITTIEVRDLKAVEVSNTRLCPV